MIKSWMTLDLWLPFEFGEWEPPTADERKGENRMCLLFSPSFVTMVWQGCLCLSRWLAFFPFSLRGNNDILYYYFPGASVPFVDF